MSDWQNIETAPKDGTVVDLWCRRSWNPPQTHERRTGVYWCRTHRLWRTEGKLHYVEDTFKPPQSDMDWRLIPTHWMPVPDPPRTAADDHGWTFTGPGTVTIKNGFIDEGKLVKE